MKYDTDALTQDALEKGFSHAGSLNVKALVFMPEVRDMCNANACRQYGTNWCCPPGCGSIEEAARRTAEYSYGLIVQTTGQMEDDFDYETIESTAKKHKENFEILIENLRKTYPDMLPMGAGTCQVCENCTYPDAPCRFPEKAMPSMEAYGLWVSKVCELSDIPYYYGPKTLTYTSCYLLK